MLLAPNAPVTRNCCCNQPLCQQYPRHIFPDRHGMRRSASICTSMSYTVPRFEAHDEGTDGVSSIGDEDRGGHFTRQHRPHCSRQKRFRYAAVLAPSLCRLLRVWTHIHCRPWGLQTRCAMLLIHLWSSMFSNQRSGRNVEVSATGVQSHMSVSLTHVSDEDRGGCTNRRHRRRQTRPRSGSGCFPPQFTELLDGNIFTVDAKRYRVRRPSFRRQKLGYPTQL